LELNSGFLISILLIDVLTFNEGIKLREFMIVQDIFTKLGNFKHDLSNSDKQNLQKYSEMVFK